MLDGNFDWMPDDPAPVFLWKSSNGKSWNNPTYHKIAVDFLKSKGISNPKVNIIKAVRIDLDADKKDEVILVGSYFQTENVWKSAFGDYSFILVRKIIGGKAQNILLKGNFNVSENNRGAVQIKHNVFAVLDLNGNGTMEIVVHSQFPETLRSEVYEIKNNRFAKVLEAGCGA